MAVMTLVKPTVISHVYSTDARIADDDNVEKPTWADDINVDDIDPPKNTKSKAELKKQRKKEKKKNKEVDEDIGVDVDEMDADLDAGGDWNDEGEEWRGTEEERKRKVDAYMDEVVNRLGFSGIVSRFGLQLESRSHVNLADLPHAYSVSLHFCGFRRLWPYALGNLACDRCGAEFLCRAKKAGALSCRQRLAYT